MGRVRIPAAGLAIEGIDFVLRCILVAAGIQAPCCHCCYIMDFINAVFYVYSIKGTVLLLCKGFRKQCQCYDDELVV